MTIQYMRRIIVEVLNSAGKGSKIDNLKIKFKVEKNLSSKPNPAEISIFNLNEKNRTLLESKDARIVLFAGYEGLISKRQISLTPFTSQTLPLIFKGYIKRFDHEKNETNIISNLECGDGFFEYSTKTFDKSYPKGTKYSKIIDDFNAEFGLAKGPRSKIEDKSLERGIAFSGMTRDELDQFTKRENLEWSIQDESLQIKKKDQPIDSKAFLINEKTGMVGSPKKTKDGIEITCLMNPFVNPGRLIKIESKFINGEFICKKITHDGDNYEGNFYSKIEGNL